MLLENIFNIEPFNEYPTLITYLNEESIHKCPNYSESSIEITRDVIRGGSNENFRVYPTLKLILSPLIDQLEQDTGLTESTIAQADKMMM
jgi:hypothetical protein